ncbi:MAG: glycine cleavage system protein GcvH [Planctomycetes bacterium]|nr:glycine cleavage system protein GcvH [Planctomycetota bacterium]
MIRPSEAKYSETHEWVIVSKKGEATIGITDYAVKQLSDIVHLELPKAGESLEQGTPFGEVESVKTVADLVSPVNGKIIAVNKEVLENPDILHEEPYEDGWLIKVKLAEKSELDSLMNAKEYQEFIESAEEAVEEKEDGPSQKGSKDDDEDIDEDDFV